MKPRPQARLIGLQQAEAEYGIPYARVAPAAAAKRPVKVIDVLLREFVVKGGAKLVEGGQS